MYDNGINGGIKDVDYVLTTREICRLIKSEQIDVASLPEEEFDSPLGEGSGAGVIFGATGGVMEAALRTSYSIVTDKNPKPDAFSNVRGMDGWKEAEFKRGRHCFKDGCGQRPGQYQKADKRLQKGDVSYDFVEIMACPGGCAGGGGQPIHDGKELAEQRSSSFTPWIRKMQSASPTKTRKSGSCITIYFGKPGSHLAHKLASHRPQRLGYAVRRKITENSKGRSNRFPVPLKVTGNDYFCPCYFMCKTLFPYQHRLDASNVHGVVIFICVPLLIIFFHIKALRPHVLMILLAADENHLRLLEGCCSVHLHGSQACLTDLILISSGNLSAQIQRRAEGLVKYR